MSTGCQKYFFRYVNMSICQYVNMSICQNATFQLGYQNESCSKCHKDVRQSLCQIVNTSVCQYANMSVCQYVRMRLFRSGIKMKVVWNVIRMSDSQNILVRKSLRTAKEPALVLPKNQNGWPRTKTT